MVAKWLGFKEASFVESYVTRGYAELKDTHELEPMFMMYLGKGFRVGAVPCDDKCAYWFFTCTPSKQGEYNTLFSILQQNYSAIEIKLIGELIGYGINHLNCTI